MAEHQHVKAALIGCNPGNVGCMKALVTECFPVSYKDEFYEKVARGYDEFTRFVTVNDVIIGGISARVEADEEGPGEKHLHILILLVLPRYRRLGLASKMLKWLTAEARKSGGGLKALRLHVQKSNEAAVAFYKRHGFVVVEELPGYYTDIPSPDALYMRLAL